MRETLASLLLSLPEDIQREAVLEYLRRLCHDGDSSRLSAMMRHIRRLDGFFPLKLDAVRLFLLHQLRQGKSGRAVAVYRCLAALEARNDPRGSRRADALWHMGRSLLPQAATPVRRLWCSLPCRELSPHAQYLYARAGALLLEALCRNADGDGAGEVLHRLRALRHPACHDILTAAEARFRKDFPLLAEPLAGPALAPGPARPERPAPPA